MSVDRTQQQTTESSQRAQELSLKSTRPPAEVPGYDTERLLGRGAYGEVWTGVDRNTGRRVAIKFYAHRSGLDGALLSREVEKLVYLSADRYVVQLLQVGWDAEPPFYVMEYVENGSLDAYLNQRGTLSVAEATELFRELSIGLIHAHGKGVLHCDLKPANILLDQDHRPRLADFGQSRLSHEQLPAFGTLFYMAPEQADLEAMPDVRWDVYALGAICYHMLTGNPPFRTEEAVHSMERSGNLIERLSRYRTLLTNAPPPTGHRRVKGMDRALAEIIDRCLATNPEGRFSNVQEVLNALRERDAVRRRRPLVLSGIVGPLLLLLVMALFGLRGYEHAMSDSEKIVTKRAKDGNEFAAKFAARSIEGEISRYFRVIRKEGDDPELLTRFSAVADSKLVKQLNDPKKSPDEVTALRPSFISDAARLELDRYLQSRLRDYLERFRADNRELKLATLLALDDRGRMLSVAYDTGADTLSVGWNYAYRSYFHGGPADLEVHKETAAENIRPITQTHLSAAFLSTTTGLWKVAVSTPLFEPGGKSDKVIGVLALTVNLGDFTYFRSNTAQDRFAVLIDARRGPNFGVILQHPLLGQAEAARGGPAQEVDTTRFRVTREQLRGINSDESFLYQDPLAAAPGGEPYSGSWIAAVDSVRLPSIASSNAEMNVLVQERLDEATAPVKELGGRLKEEGLWALGGVVAVIAVLWYVVIRMLAENPAR